ncbi:hypothetical protein BGX28_003325 [Mortierella sp. GBA30]|nr:hypothetical protein BGX28_003325 [Mortierella sp. GBA30]
MPLSQPSRDPAPFQHQSTASEGANSNGNIHLFMKPLTSAPDYRFNLYVKGLAPTTTTRGLFDLFRPYGNILACKTIVDNDTGFCRGGFVLFDNQESCTEARRALTQQGLYITVAHESVSIKNLPVTPNASERTKPVVPKIDNSEDFPSLPSKFPRKKPQGNKTFPASSPSASTTELKSVNNPAKNITSSSMPAKGLEINESPTTTPSSTENPCNKADVPVINNDAVEGVPSLGQSYLDFDGGFIGSHQQFLSDGYSNAAEFQRRPSLLEHQYSVNAVDQYMDMLEQNAHVMAPQPSSNTEGARLCRNDDGARISKTMIEDFMLEDRPRRESSLYFENLSEGLKYQKLFEICSQYGPLVLTSVDIRYINEECGGQGKVTFESHKDSEAALFALSESNYRVHRDYDEIYSSEVGIDEQLYDQYFQQHMDYLKLDSTHSYGSPDEILSSPFQQGYFQPSAGIHQFAPRNSESHNPEDLWSTPTSGMSLPLENNLSPRQRNESLSDADSISNVQEKLSMLGISPLPTSLSPISSSSSSPAVLREWSESSSPVPPLERPTNEGHGNITKTMNESTQELQFSSSSTVPRGQAKMISYSDAVKVPTKPRNNQHVESNYEPCPNPPRHDLKRRGNTNKSLDEKEYRLNLYLKDLEPTMDEFKLYEICVQ